MKFNKFLRIVIASFPILFLSNNGQASVIFGFNSDGRCILECDNRTYEFNSVSELSENINSIANDYFTVDSITNSPNYDTISLKNFNNIGGTNRYQLIFRGNTRIDLDFCCYNNVNLPKIKLEDGAEINLTYSITNTPPNLRESLDQTRLEMDLDDYEDEEIVFCNII